MSSINVALIRPFKNIKRNSSHIKGENVFLLSPFASRINISSGGLKAADDARPAGEFLGKSRRPGGGKNLRAINRNLISINQRHS